MGYIQGAGREQRTQFPGVLDDLVTADHLCSVIDAFVEKLSMSELGFERAQAAEDRTTWLRSARFVEAVSVLLSEPDHGHGIAIASTTVIAPPIIAVARLARDDISPPSVRLVEGKRSTRGHCEIHFCGV